MSPFSNGLWVADQDLTKNHKQQENQACRQYNQQNIIWRAPAKANSIEPISQPKTKEVHNLTKANNSIQTQSKMKAAWATNEPKS